MCTVCLIFIEKYSIIITRKDVIPLRKGFLILLVFCVLLTAACSGAGDSSVSDAASDTVSESVSENVSENVSESEQSDVSQDVSVDIMSTAKKIIRTLDYKNKGKMGDIDGPAFAVYSKIGYRGASVKLNLADAEIKTVLPDGRFINGYAFLGIDVYEGDKGSEWWVNCVDAGLCWSGVDGGWHIFYNIYQPLNDSTPTWYESSRILPKNDIYTMTLEITDDNYAKLTVVGEKTKWTDSVTLEVKGAKKGGSNTSFLFNTALDYPPDTKVDRHGNACEDWTEITLANSDKGLYLRNFHATELSLSFGETEIAWENRYNQAVSIWPDKTVSGFDYSPTEVGIFDGTEYFINLDMNR